jgi:hypothetical protein
MSEFFSELDRLEKLLATYSNRLQSKLLTTVHSHGREFPVHSITIGSPDKSKPVLGLFGGVHGLERVGSQAVLSYLEGLFEQMRWDSHLVESFNHCRIVSIPIVNPGGMFSGTRSNPQGVDLMRNAPVEAEAKPIALLGGHRLSPLLPWYRGEEGKAMQPEAQALCDLVREEIFPSEAALVLDLHSGFGSKDYLWYPYAKSREPFPRAKEVEAFRVLLDRSYPNHVYAVEPQSATYTTHGDLWDYLFDEHWKKAGINGPVFLPWTLEMGSWMWIRKNPSQLFSLLGAFNPVKPHRHKRIMRRHLPLLDFFLRAVRNHKTWLPR